MLAFASVSLLFLASAAAEPPANAKPKPPGPDGELKPGPTAVAFPKNGPLLVRDVIQSLSLDEAKMLPVEDSSGKLRAIRWSRVVFAGAVVDVELEVVATPVVVTFAGKSVRYETELDIWNVRAARVTKVTIFPAAKRVD